MCKRHVLNNNKLNFLFLILFCMILAIGCGDFSESDNDDYLNGSCDIPLLVQEAKSNLEQSGVSVSVLSLGKSHVMNTRAFLESIPSKCRILWEESFMSCDGGLPLAVIPLDCGDMSAFSVLTVHGRSRKSVNKVCSKLLVRKNSDGTLTTVVGTYIYDGKYGESHESEIRTLSVDFSSTEFSGYFITSRLDGTFLYGRKYVNGQEEFCFNLKDRLHSDCSVVGDSVFIPDTRLFINLQSEQFVTRSSMSTYTEDSGFKCLFCGEDAMTCSCLEINYCSKCRSKIVNGQCNCQEDDGDYPCAFCGQKFQNGKCMCCTFCGHYPCVCNGGGVSNGGGGIGGGTSTGNTGGGPTGNTGGSTSGSSVSHVKTTAQIKTAARDAVRSIISRYGTDMAACNYGVQAAFKNLFGTTNLPPGMTGRANDMWQLLGKIILRTGIQYRCLRLKDMPIMFFLLLRASYLHLEAVML